MIFFFDMANANYFNSLKDFIYFPPGSYHNMISSPNFGRQAGSQNNHSDDIINAISFSLRILTLFLCCLSQNLGLYLLIFGGVRQPHYRFSSEFCSWELAWRNKLLVVSAGWSFETSLATLPFLCYLFKAAQPPVSITELTLFDKLLLFSCREWFQDTKYCTEQRRYTTTKKLIMVKVQENYTHAKLKAQPWVLGQENATVICVIEGHQCNVLT